MTETTTHRGFRLVEHPTYIGEINARLIQESSAVGPYDDSASSPGSSFLWIGTDHHLNREEVAELVAKMQHWLDNGRLPDPR